MVILLLINSVGDNLEWLCSNADLENGPCLSHYRRYILDIIPAVASHRALRFLRHKMERQELTNWEAAQTVLVALHSSTPTRDVMEEATVGFSKHSRITLLILASVIFIPLTRWQRLWKYKGFISSSEVERSLFPNCLKGRRMQIKRAKMNPEWNRKERVRKIPLRDRDYCCKQWSLVFFCPNVLYSYIRLDF